MISGLSTTFGASSFTGFRSPTLSASGFGFSIAFGAMLLSVVLWDQEVWGWSALQTGLAIAPGPLPPAAASAAPESERNSRRLTMSKSSFTCRIEISTFSGRTQAHCVSAQGTSLHKLGTAACPLLADSVAKLFLG